LGSTQHAPVGAALHAALEAAQAEGLAPNVRRWLRLQGATAGEWVEAQALHVPDGKWTSNRFAHAPDSATLVGLLGQADTWGAPGIYVIANRIDPAVATRRASGTWHTAQKGEGTSDRDIRARAVFYVDVDVERPKGTSATDAQVLLAHDRAVEIYSALGGALGGTDPLGFGHSGNGRALFVALDFLPETAELRATVGGLLAAVRARFQGGGILIDVTVADAKRLVPAFGTMKRKGAAGIAEYPHRRTAIVVPERVRRIGLDELTQLLAGMRAGLDDEQQRAVNAAMGARAAPAAPAARPPRPAPSRGAADGRASAFDLAKQVPIDEVLSWLGLMDGANPVCCGCGLTGDSSVAIVGNGLKCSHERCAKLGAPGRPGFRTTIDVVMEAREVAAAEAVKLLAAQFGFAAPAPVREAPESGTSGVPAEVLDRVAANIVRALGSAPAPIRSKRELFALVKGRKETFLAVVDHLVATGRLDIIRGAFRLPGGRDGTGDVGPEGGDGAGDVVPGPARGGSRSQMEPPGVVPGGSRNPMEPPGVVPGTGEGGSRTQMEPPVPDREPVEDHSGNAPDCASADRPRHRSPFPKLIEGTDRATDLANADAFVAAHGDTARWNTDLGGWYCYDERRWARDIALAERWAQDLAREMLRDAEGEHRAALKTFTALTAAGDMEGAERAQAKVNAAKSRVSWARRTQNAPGLAAMLRTAQCQRSVRPQEFDPDPWLLNVANGTLDLKTGQLREHRRDDMITKITLAPFDPEARCPRWNEFLEQVQPNPEVRGFLHRLVGYSITGTIREHMLPISYGDGRNGKGMFINTLLQVVGDYGVAVPPELLMVKRHEAHPTERTVLYGARLASAQETEENRTLNVALVKSLTGGDPIRARRMREDFWEFLPTHKLWLSTNHKPRIPETKAAIWERVFLIPWEVFVANDQRDVDLGTNLLKEAAGILAWAVAGSREYQRIGLAPPRVITAATRAYREQEDRLAPFLVERCVLAADARVTRSELRAAYIEWADQNGIEAVGRMAAEEFAGKLRERGIEDVASVRNATTRMPDRGWRGIRLKTKTERLLDGEVAEAPSQGADADLERDAIAWERGTRGQA
jgi:putative DNA primase/helicase